MSQSIRISSSGLSPILPHKSSSPSSCMFRHRCMEVSGLNLSLVKEECSSISSRKRASVVVSNHNPRIPPFLLPCATLSSSSSIVDDEGDNTTNTNTNTSGRSKYCNPDYYNILKIPLSDSLFKWRTFLYKLIPAAFDHPPQVNAEVVIALVLWDHDDYIEGLKVLLDVSRAWRSILYLCRPELCDGKIIRDDYVETYYSQKPRGTYKSRNYRKKNYLSRMTTRLSILRLLTDHYDPYEGVQVMLEALDIWETHFILNDSGGYLQKEIFAILDLSQRLRNRNDKHDEAKYPVLAEITHVVEILKPIIDHFEGSNDPSKATSEAYRSWNDAISYALVAVVADLNMGDICCLFD